MSERERECPECGKGLRRDEDPCGITYQCLAHDCLSMFSRHEIEGDDLTVRAVYFRIARNKNYLSVIT